MYRETIAALERDFPEVTFVHVTVPLMTEQGQLSKLKSRLTGSSRYGPAANVARERLNALIRREYAGDTSSTWRRSSPPRPTAAALPAPTRGSSITGCTTATLRLRPPQWRGCPSRSHRMAEGDRPGLPEVAAVDGGVGTDIVAVGRIAALMRDRGTAFLERWFTAREIDYCSSKAVPSRHFAARFAAKEAVVKALPVAWDGPLPWRSIEIVNDPRGAPSASLSGASWTPRRGPGSARSGCLSRTAMSTPPRSPSWPSQAIGRNASAVRSGRYGR